MKKAKEGLMFLALLVMPLVLFFVISGFATDLISDRPNFVGVCFCNYRISYQKKDKSTERDVLFRQCNYWRGYHFDL